MVILSDDDQILMITNLKAEGSFHFQGLLPGTYGLTVSTDDGRVGRLAAVTLGAGDHLDYLELELEPAGTLVISYEGSKEYGQYRVLQDNLVYAGDGLRTGTQARVTVPVGRVEVRLSDETRTAEIVAGEEVSVHFEIPE